ncbi:Nif3-like dinuclear metal center hexameric protein [Agrilactobacillus fermenti]|uniref:Nif3-like dinuclear metal center hexameric protein n=1 Tax=Agrilactobacillus fermenti TaxID=2586909 RepID=UPI001E5E3453|nr:Nif3-like dinuclear metal center hexameric protein [Agrilactobacillus fermenti]MCD2255822.1 Nif3-like dinuclear metal center hexameric protein [Agrilactobacillus fermenti]
MTTGTELIHQIESLAPLMLKEPQDPSGLQLGDPTQPVHKIMVTLDVRPEVVAEAIAANVDFIFAHHPVMFHPARNLDTRDPQNKMYADLLSHHITVYAAHTNLDKAQGGMNDWLAEKIGLQDIQVLASQEPDQLYKFVVFTPLENADQMRHALGDAGAGMLGNYSHASFTGAGQGRFLPENHANPTIGAIGKAETVQESRIEFLIRRTQLTTMVATMRANHPYEEPAFDLIPLANTAPSIGLGRIGNLPEPVTVQALAQQIKHDFGLSGLRYVSPDPSKLVQKVAVIGGDAGKFYPNALKAHADVLITGDVYYHTAHDMLAAGLNVIDPGHHIESIVKTKMTALIQQWAVQFHWDVTCISSQLSTDPFRFI